MLVAVGGHHQRERSLDLEVDERNACSGHGGENHLSVQRRRVKMILGGKMGKNVGRGREESNVCVEKKMSR